MAHGDFVWCDLSARTVGRVSDFYTRLFNWRYQVDQAPDGSDYHIAQATDPVGGIFAMPEKFVAMGMPCFWMSYIEVASVTTAIATATAQGGKVEVGPIAGSGGATIALIRDPLGAGFTVIEGAGLVVRSDTPGHGEMAWNALYVSDLGAVAPFYQALFDWTLAADDHDAHHSHVIIHGATRSAIHQLPDSVRGEEQYWGVHFAVDDLAAARSVVSDHGTIVQDGTDTLVARDPDGAAFFLLQGAR